MGLLSSGIRFLIMQRLYLVIRLCIQLYDKLFQKPMSEKLSPSLRQAQDKLKLRMTSDLMI